MQISFHPALGETVRVSPLFTAPVQQFYFTATFGSREDYEEYIRTGIRVELWSNIAGNGQWAGQTFQDCRSPLNTGIDPPRHSPTIGLSLASQDAGHDEIVLRNTLSLLFSTSKDAFEYTYRLVYPSGEIVWLGHTFNNGRIIQDKSNPLLSLLHDRWLVPGPATRVASDALWEANGYSCDSTEVAKLNLDVGRECTIWALGRDGRVGSFPDPISSASLVFVVPRICADSVVIPPAFAMTSSPGSSISLNSLGGIAFTGPGDSSLFLQIYNPGSDLKAFMERVLLPTDHPPHTFQLLGCEPTSGLVVVAPPKNANPGSVLIIQNFPTPSSFDVHIDIQTLTTLLPNASRFSLFSPTSFQSRFFDVLPESPADDAVSFTISPTGGHLVVAPAHSLGEDGAWDVSVLTPHVPSPKVEHALPTPPDSPTLRPIAHLTLQRSHTSSSVSIPSLSDIGTALTDRRTTDARVAPTRTWAAQLVRLAKYSLAFMLVIFRALLNMLLGTFFTRSARKTVSSPRGVVSDATHATEVLSDVSDPRPDSPAPVATPNKVSGGAAHYVNTHGGCVSILLRRQRVNASVHDVLIEFDGRIVDWKVKEIGEGVFFVEFDGGAIGGQVKVSLR